MSESFISQAELVLDLPALDADPASEVGVVMMGAETPRLLATLGAATATAELGQLAVIVENAMHRGAAEITFASVLDVGVNEWRRRSRILDQADPGRFRSGAPREAFRAMYQVVRGAFPIGTSEAVLICLAACWFRREEITEWTERYAAEH